MSKNLCGKSLNAGAILARELEEWESGGEKKSEGAGERGSGRARERESGRAGELKVRHGEVRRRTEKEAMV